MAITNARMQIKRGNEVDFDAEKMLVGEWALSTDKRIVRICVAPNVCIRMATYDAFEVDMAQIDKILEECRTIEDVVKLINSQVSEKLELTIEYTNQAKQYRDEAKTFRDEAESFTPDGYSELQEMVASNTAKIDTIIDKAELNIKNSASGENLHLTDSANGKNVGFGLYGKAEQNGEPTPDNPIEITVAGGSGSVEVVTENEDSTQSTTAIIPTPNGLCGIKVSSGGNYTDENGQQWICDEVVKYADGSGKRIQRIGKKIITEVGSSVVLTLSFSNYTRFYVNTFIDRKASGSALDGICNMATFDNLKNTDVEEGKGKCFFNTLDEYSNFFYIQISKETLNATISDDDATQKALADALLSENPTIVYYVLAEPIITDLSAEEIAEIEKIHTFYPITNISNDADCGMSITYTCDSKRYIDNRIEELASALLVATM